MLFIVNHQNIIGKDSKKKYKTSLRTTDLVQWILWWEWSTKLILHVLIRSFFIAGYESSHDIFKWMINTIFSHKTFGLKSDFKCIRVFVHWMSECHNKLSSNMKEIWLRLIAIFIYESIKYIVKVLAHFWDTSLNFQAS